MLEFIQLLNQRYQAVIAHLKKDDPLGVIYQQRLEQLIFSEAFIRKGQLLEDSSATPLQIAVIGPTQAGKSAISNLLLNSQNAGVSPLAGYTVHPQGFCCHTKISDNVGLQNYFGRFQQLSINELTANRYDCYALTESQSQSTLLPDCVFWDTPDFDSIDSVDYREGVIRTIALADIVVLVVSKEKYADHAVWEMMSTIECFHQPTIICVNKLMEGTEDIIIQSLAEKWQQARGDALPDIVPLLYQKQSGLPVWPEASNELFFQVARKVTQNKHFEYQHDLLNKYWHSWLEPVVAEHEAVRLWCDLIDKYIEQALKDYQRDYLNHSQHYDTFQDALIKLLDLLEIPGISKVLTKTRRILTWPVRKLMRLGKKHLTENTGTEEAILEQIGEHLFISLADQLLVKIDSDSKQHDWWKDTYCLLRQERDRLLTDYKQTIDVYSDSFQGEVGLTANGLYNQLSEHPILLNSLRASRVTTDAAAMALVIQTGGIGVHDLVITPAMLSITSLLAESALGGYMTHAEAQLKKKQLVAVKQQLFIEGIKKALYQLPDQLSDKNRFNISIERLQQAEQQRKEKKHGIRRL